ncbi:hypothetical protein MSAN_00875600 [Mycena sanguinolenta]|uniref:Uncharacterized protein n=1 Tax=Mycena sanguinolenta TaxID=230812 RepID=A0A8H7DAB3_9AGAR|nr:hypothetical protein MSAN_00875600 [Mycena sanguinolenta]
MLAHLRSPILPPMNLGWIFVLLLSQQFANALVLHTNAFQSRQSVAMSVPIPAGADLIQFVSNNDAAPDVTFAFNTESTVISIAPITDVISFSFVGTAITTVPIPSGAISMQIILTNSAAAPDINIVIEETTNIVVVSGLFGGSSVDITTSGQISMTSAQVVAAINLVSNISQALVNDINAIISSLNTTVTILEASGPLDTTEMDHSRLQIAGATIVAALDNFVAVHQAFLATIISKHSIFAQFQVTAPIAAVLRNLEIIIDSFAFALIDVIPQDARRAVQPQLGTVSSDKSALDTAVGDTITVYDEICIPSSLYPVVLPTCVSNALALRTSALRNRESTTSVSIPPGTDLIQIVSNNDAAPNVTLAVNGDSTVVSIAPITEITSLEFIGGTITTVPIPHSANSLQITLQNSAVATDINIGVEGTINTVQVSGVNGSSVDILS